MNVIVHRWITQNNKKTYKFDPNDSKYIPIFADDTIEIAITKIALIIASFNEDETNLDYLPYVWTDKKQLRTKFNVKFPINPWKYKNPIGNVSTTYIDNEIFDEKEVNILFYNDASEIIQKAPFYFPDKSVKWTPTDSLQKLKNQANLLYDTWKLSENINTIKHTFTYTKVEFNNDEIQIKTNTTLDSIFENTNTSDMVPFIQYCKDISKIKYKLNKNHKIPTNLIQQWTLYEKLPKVSMIVFMIHLKSSDVYARCSITSTFNIDVRYIIDSKSLVEWEKILQHSLLVKSYLQQILKQPVTLICNSLSLKVDIPDQNVKIATFSKNIRKNILLFSIIKQDDKELIIRFKKTKYQEEISIDDYIKNQIKHGIEIDEIKNTLEEQGISKQDIDYWIDTIENEDEERDKSKKVKSMFSGCIIKITKNASSYKITMENVSSIDESKRILRWLYSTLRTKSEGKKKPVKFDKIPEPGRGEPGREPGRGEPGREPGRGEPGREPGPVEEEKPFEEVGDVNGDIDYELSDGGAAGTDRYFIDLLKKADPKLFQDNEYARKCGANQYRQPVVISEEEKEKLVTDGFENWDNIIKYGTESKKNYYFCPKIWCPTSKIPLSEQQLKKYNNKCPKTESNNYGDEIPILLYDDPYWDSDIKASHNIGFHSTEPKNGFCLPCCFKKALNDKNKKRCGLVEKEPNQNLKLKSDSKSSIMLSLKDTYIMTAVAPIPEGRYGSIPKQLHNILLPNVGYHICSTSLSQEPCMVRKGIKQSSDSLLDSIAVLLKLSDKKALIKEIKSKLSSLKYLALENGHLYQVFSETIPNSEKNKKLIAQSNEWNNNLLSVNDLRNLSIYKSYLNFIDYLNSNDQKNIHHIIAILELLGYILVVLQKYGNNDVTFQCSAYSRGIGDQVIFLFYDAESNIYEPLELKQKNKIGETIFSLRKYPYIIKLLNRCKKQQQYSFIDNLTTIKAYLEIVDLDNPINFEPDTIILRQDLEIYGVLTKKNLLIIMPIGMYSIDELLVATKYKIIFLEDIQGEKRTIRVFKSDLEIFKNKIRDMGFGLNIGTETKSDSPLIYNAILEIPEINLSIPPKIIQHSHDKFDTFILQSDKVSKKWFQIQNDVGKELLMHYDTLVLEVMKQPTRILRIRKLMNSFPNRDKNILQAVLEEIPFSYGKDAISKWLSLINIDKTAKTYYDNNVVDNGKEWIFSQTRIDNGIPKTILYPKVTFEKKDIVEDYNVKEKELEKMPKMMKFVKRENLPGKWGKLSKSYNINIIESYTKDSIEDLFNWISIKINKRASWDDIKKASLSQILDTLRTKEQGIKLLKEDTFMTAFSDYFKKEKTPELLWSKHLDKLSYDERTNIILQLFQKELILPNDFDIRNMAKLLNINIFLIHRADSGDAKQLVLKRGDINDRLISSSFFKAFDNWKSQTLLMLYKNSQSVYNVISSQTFDKNDIILFEINSIPKELDIVIKSHLSG